MNKEKFDRLVNELRKRINDASFQKELRSAEDAGVAHKGNMGMILADAILQRRRSYDNFVLPRVGDVKKLGDTMAKVRKNRKKFNDFFEKKGGFPEANQHTFVDILRILEEAQEKIETAKDLKKWLSKSSNRKLLEKARWVGNKTSRYLYQLCGGDNICVDTHIRGYVNDVALDTGLIDSPFKDNEKDNLQVEDILKAVAGDLPNIEIEVSCRRLDSAIWNMRSKMGRSKK